MKNLAQRELAEKTKHIAAIEAKRDALQAAIDAFNKTVGEATGTVEQAVEALNDAISDADSWREAIVTNQSSFYDDKSERWQESDAGQNYALWMGEWEDGVLEPVEIEFPEELVMPDCDALDKLENLPDEVG